MVRDRSDSESAPGPPELPRGARRSRREPSPEERGQAEGPQLQSQPGPPKFPRGAIPTPREVCERAPKYAMPSGVAPAEFAVVPKVLSMWGNDRYGICVTSEEAFAKACHEPEIDIKEDVVIAWARERNYLNGAMLDEVMDDMIQQGFRVGNQLYNDGPYHYVDYMDEDTLKSAIADGPVKIAIAADALPGDAGQRSGWYSIQERRYSNTDHCVGLCGYGSAKFLYEKLGVPLPSALKPDLQGYLLFTWSTIGFVSHGWLRGTCTEAWLRDPTTVGVPPLPEPKPPVPPDPPVPPIPHHDDLLVILEGEADFGLFTVPISLEGTATCEDCPDPEKRKVRLNLPTDWLQTLIDLLMMLLQFLQAQQSGPTTGRVSKPERGSEDGVARPVVGPDSAGHSEPHEPRGRRDARHAGNAGEGVPDSSGRAGGGGDGGSGGVVRPDAPDAGRRRTR